MTTRTTNKTKEQFSVWAKSEDGEIYHYVPRDDRFTYLEEREILITVGKTLITEGLVTVKVTLGIGSDYHQGIGSCRIANTNTEDPAGLAYKKAVDNALQTLGVGMTLENGQPISSLNRAISAEEAVKSAMEAKLP